MYIECFIIIIIIIITIITVIIIIQAKGNVSEVFYQKQPKQNEIAPFLVTFWPCNRNG